MSTCCQHLPPMLTLFLSTSPFDVDSMLTTRNTCYYWLCGFLSTCVNMSTCFGRSAFFLKKWHPTMYTCFLPDFQNLLKSKNCEMEKSYFKNKYRLRRLAKICNWPPGYRKPAMYPVVGVWGYLTESLFIITYVYEHDFKTTAV